MKRGYMMRQHSKVVHASSDGEHLRAAKVQERMASSISVDWGNKRAPQNLQVLHLEGVLTVAKGCASSWSAKTFEGDSEVCFSPWSPTSDWSCARYFKGKRRGSPSSGEKEYQW